jgi:biopolymer transport protein ExbB
MAALLLLGFVPAALAQGAAGRGDALALGGIGLSWREVLDKGGWLMYVLLAMSLLGVALVIYFFVVLRVSHVAPRPLQRELADRIRAGAVDEARRACEYRSCPLSAVTLAALDYLRDVPNTDAELLHDVIESAGGRQAEGIQGMTQYLLDIAATAPMVGLLGTVFGMLQAFGGVARGDVSAQPVALAAGVSQALITTAFGLIVGIPAMMFYAYFRRKAAKLVAYLEAASTDVLAALQSKRI